jgi:O-antigen ligase
MNRSALSTVARTGPARPSVGTTGPAAGSPPGAAESADLRLSWSLLLALLFGTLMAGRFTVSRWGMPEAYDFDIRIPLFGVLLCWFLVWISEARQVVTGRWPAAVKLVLLHFGVLLLAGAWAQPRARVVTSLFDLLVLLAIVVMALVAARRAPRRAALQFVVMLYATGILYAVLGLVGGSFSYRGRLAALGGGPNVFVRVVVLGLLAAVVLAVHHRRIWYLAPAPLLGYAAVLSGSRGGLISALVTALVALLYYARRIKPGHVVGGVLLILAALGFLTGTDAEGRLAWIDRRYSIEQLTTNQYAHRPALIQQALEIFSQHPIIGAGIDSFAATYAPGQSGAYAHNYFASVAADTGILGLCVLGIALLAVMAAAWRRLRTATAAQAGLLFGALFVLAASNFSGDYYDSRFCWVFLAVALAGLTGRRAVGATGRAVGATGLSAHPRTRRRVGRRPR